MKKFWMIAISACFLCMTSACSGSGLEHFNEDQLHDASVEVIEQFNEKDYDGVVARFSESIQGQVTGEQLKQVWDENFSEVGDFVDYGDFTYAEKNDNGFVEVIVNYQNNKVKYTISFDTNMKLTNFFIK